MKPKFRSLIAAFAPLSHTSLIVCASLCVAGSASAASETWDGETDANWATVTNWVSNTGAPGIIYTANNTNTTNVATFNAPINLTTLAGSSGNPVVTETNRMIGRIVFDTANAGSHFIGATTGSPTLTFGNNLTILDVTSTVENPQTINAPVALHLPSSTNGGFTIQNNAASSAATLTLAGGILNSPNSSRGTVATIRGTNSGESVVSGNITLTNTGGVTSSLTKADAGTWVLTGTNTFAPAGGVIVNGGVLAVTNEAALGTNGTANAQAAAVNGGVLEIRNGITINNGVSLNLNNGGTIRSNGTNGTNGRVNVGVAVGTVATLATVGSGDVFTVGNAVNELTGGASDAILNVSGPGTISLPFASNYGGGWMINDGSVLMGSSTSLGSITAASISFGASSTGKLVLNSFSPTVIGLSTNATPGTPVIENGTSGTSLLTVNNTTSQTFAGALNDGAAGVLAFTKGGAGSLTLNGANSYTGATIVSGGTLNINNAAATASVTVGGVSSLGGSGSIAGAVTISGPAHLAPGSSVGTLTMGSLTLGLGSVLDYEFAGSNDMAVVTTSGGLTLNGGGFNLYQEGGTTQFATEGDYNLIQYSGTLNGTTDNLSVLNPDPTKNYQFTADGTHVILSITASVISEWGLTTGGNWASAGSWTGAGIPNASGTTAIFGNVLASSDLVTMNGNKTVGTVAFDNAGSSYTISPATSESLFLDNTANSGQAQIIGTNGSHQITAPVVLTSNTVATIANGIDTITLSGIVSGSGNLNKGGPGTLSLTGANTFDGEITIANGRLVFAPGSLGAGTDLSIGGGTLSWATGNTEDVSATRVIEFLPGGATFDTNGNDVVFASAVGASGAGGLVKSGAGSLSLAALNTYLGNTTISGGTLSIAADSSLGGLPGLATPGSLSIGDGTLSSVGTFTIDPFRGIQLSSASSSVSVDGGSTLTYGGLIEGTGKLNVTGTGILDLSATNIYNGGTRIESGATLNLSGVGTPGTGQVALEGGLLTLNRNLYNQGNIFVGESQTGTVDGLNDRVGISGLSGSGTITLVSRYAGVNVGSGANGFRLFTGNGGFTGTVNLKSGTGTVNSFAAYFNGGGFDGNFSGATIHMTDNARIGGVNNSGGNTMTIGALSGDSTAILAGADYAGTHTYNIGGKNISTEFPGSVVNGSAGAANLIKSGTESLTLSGTNTYTGTTTVNGGVLAVVNATSLGTDAGGTTVAGGDVDSRVTITGGLTLNEPWTLGGRQGANVDSAAIVSLAGANVISGLVTPITGGTNYNIQCDAGTLTMGGNFVPTGAVTGVRYLQLLGDGDGEWSGAIQNGTAVVTLNCKSAGTWTLSGINTYTGETQIDSGSTLVLDVDGEIKFAPTTNDTSGKVTGGGTADLDGKFNIDLTAAEVLEGNQWTLVDIGDVSYDPTTFTVVGFTKSGTEWTRSFGGNLWKFDQLTGLLTVTIVPSGYGSWASNPANGLTDGVNDGPNDDPDNDGIDNLLEFVLGGLPMVSSPEILPELDASGANFIFTFTREDDSEAEVVLTFQHGSTLAGWTEVAIGAEDALPVVDVEENLADPDNITVTIPKDGATEMFGRLRAVK